MNLKNRITADDSAVSPVIGVILMVAITVILAAVIGTFVLGLGGSQSSNASAGVSFEGTAADGINATLTSIGDNTQKVTLKITGGTSTCKFYNGGSATKTRDLTAVGDTAGIVAGDCTTGVDIQVIGVTENGNKNVLRTYTTS